MLTCHFYYSYNNTSIISFENVKCENEIAFNLLNPNITIEYTLYRNQ